MRPDKHKKKNHAAYARKAAEKTGKSVKPSSTGNQGKGGSRPHQEEEVNRGEKNKREPLEERCPVEQEQFEITSFSRRKIESNWQQYDERPEDEDVIEQRGADFTLLLNQTAGSQFRFKDEGTLDEETAQSGISSSLSFDCNQLAEKLQSIPLPERLEISRIFFDQETLMILDQDAATNEPLSVDENRKPTTPTTGVKKISDNTYFDQDLDEILSKTGTESAPVSADVSAMRGSSPSADGPGCTADTSSKGSSNNTIRPQNHQTDQSEDDVLDFLLTLSSADSDHPNGPPSLDTFRKHEAQSAGNMESIDISPKETASPGEPLVSKECTTASVKTESFDDWLDSILDD